jgi:serine/threonine-protein kinase
MSTDKTKDPDNIEIAQRWCANKGKGWDLRDAAGQGKTAPVFVIDTPEGERALKIYTKEYSAEIDEKRVEQQIIVGVHECPSLVNVYEGGRFDGRLYVLMSKAPGNELAKRLKDIPRNKIRGIVGQIAQAVVFLRMRGMCHRDIKCENIYISDDFNTATLLDISTMREINDPVGIGTDHGGTLPIVATARYCSPEYLFRLVEPGADLWHALDVYQLGGVLHDLIMQEPLFQEEYIRAPDNRYRFAWVVATQVPIITSPDADFDLIMLARQALDKDWRRRSNLRIEDFMNDSRTQQLRGLEAFRFRENRQVSQRTNTFNGHLRIKEIAANVKTHLVEKLRDEGITAAHHIAAGGTDSKKRIELTWGDGARRICFCIYFILPPALQS